MNAQFHSSYQFIISLTPQKFITRKWLLQNTQEKDEDISKQNELQKNRIYRTPWIVVRKTHTKKSK